MMLRPGVAGPFRATAEVSGGGRDRLAVELTLRDEGREDRVISVAQAVYRRV
jgi:acyl-coenzyme A thioesterase PaaI-like protein